MWRWLESTVELQTQVYGYPIGDYVDRVLQERVDQEVVDQLDIWQTAAVQELAEVREEFSWKPWATDPPFVNRDRVIDEIVDVNHFLANMLIVVGCTDNEYEYRYQKKQQKNRERQLSGTYSARKGGLAEGSDV